MGRERQTARVNVSEGGGTLRCCQEQRGPTLWSTTRSSIVNLPHAVNYRVLCGENLVTLRSKFRANQTLELLGIQPRTLRSSYTGLYPHGKVTPVILHGVVSPENSAEWKQDLALLLGEERHVSDLQPLPRHNLKGNGQELLML